MRINHALALAAKQADLFRASRRLGAPESCEVLGDVFSYVVQGSLCVIVVSTCLIKWRMETPRREFKVLLLDSSKQMVGSGMSHCMNIVTSMLFAMTQDEKGDECGWYWVNLVLDTTFGLFVCYWLLRLTESVFGYDSGHYGVKGAETFYDGQQHPDYGKWAQQILAWCAIVGCMKLVTVGILFAYPVPWVWLGAKATTWITNTHWRLLFVMVFTPTVMNIFQFCVADTFLKSNVEPNRKEEGLWDPKKEELLQGTPPTTQPSSQESLASTQPSPRDERASSIVGLPLTSS